MEIHFVVAFVSTPVNVGTANLVATIIFVVLETVLYEVKQEA